jgi:hypothetical protein
LSVICALILAALPPNLLLPKQPSSTGLSCYLAAIKSLGLCAKREFRILGEKPGK